MSDAAVLLDELRSLRRATQADARRYAPPLLVFGVLVIAAVAVTEPLPVGQLWTGRRIDQLGANGAVPLAHPWLVNAYWLGALVAGTLFTAWWYHWRAARLGVELRSREQLLTAGATLLGFLVGVPALQAILGVYYWPDTEPYVHIALLVISALVAVAALVWSAAGERSRPQRVAGLAAGTLAATVAAAAVAMYLQGYTALLVIAAVVVVLAWIEHSRWLGVVAAAFAGASLLAQAKLSDYNYLGWYTGVSGQATVFHDLLLPSAVLLAGGVVGLATRWRTR